MTRQVIERDRLGVLTKIGQGGQGVVYRAPNVKTKFAASMVYKEYKPQTRGDIDFTALAAMPALVEDSLSYAQAERLISIAAWPCALVEDGGASTGFVMPAIPDEFFIALKTVKGVSNTTAEFQHLLNHSSVLAARGITLDDVQRYSLLREVASGLAFLHKHGVCVGDISPKNLLFSLTPHEAVYFIDCDAMRINKVSALPQMETPGWDVPAGEELATIYSDAYKLGLLALRLVAGDHDTKNLQHLPSTTPGLLRQIITDTLSKAPQQRPLPEAWSYVLGHAIEQAQHQKKTPTPTPTPASVPPAAPPTPIVHSRPSSRPSAPPPPPPPPPIVHSRPPVTASAPPPRQPASSSKIWAVGLAALVVAAVVVIAVALAIHNNRAPSSAPETSIAAPTIAPPVAVTALEGLWLSPDQMNTAMSATGMMVAGTIATMDDTSAYVPDKACLRIEGAAEATIYEGSGWSAVRGQILQEPGDKWTHRVAQYVVLFTSAQDAGAFFTASAQRWPACANRQFTATLPGQPDQVWSVGPVSNTNGTLSAASTFNLNNVTVTCQRALTVTNNVAIDLLACSKNQSDSQSDSAVDIAHQIAAKVPTT